MPTTHQVATGDQAGYMSHSTHKNARYLWFKATESQPIHWLRGEPNCSELRCQHCQWDTCIHTPACRCSVPELNPTPVTPARGRLKKPSKSKWFLQVIVGLWNFTSQDCVYMDVKVTRKFTEEDNLVCKSQEAGKLFWKKTTVCLSCFSALPPAPMVPDGILV